MSNTEAMATGALTVLTVTMMGWNAAVLWPSWLAYWNLGWAVAIGASFLYKLWEEA